MTKDEKIANILTCATIAAAGTLAQEGKSVTPDGVITTDEHKLNQELAARVEIYIPFYTKIWAQPHEGYLFNLLDPKPADPDGPTPEQPKLSPL